MDKQLKELGTNARVAKRALEQDLTSLQKQVENVNSAIALLDQLETNLANIGESNGVPRKNNRSVKTKRVAKPKNQPSYTAMLDELVKKGKPFTSRDYAEFCTRYIKKPSKGSMSQALFSRLQAKEIKAAGKTKPTKVGGRTIPLKLYKAA